MGLFQRCPGYLRDDTPSRNRLSDSQEHLCDVCSEMKEIDAQIMRTQNLLADLAEKRIATNSRWINRLHDPFSCIPFEIASQIFILYTNDVKRKGLSGISISIFKDSVNWSPSLFLASISNGWRQIALATPELWTSIDIQVYSLSKIPLQAELLNQYLARSGERPLDIFLYAEQKVAGPRDSSVKMSPLFDVIRHCAMRWQKLTLNIPQHLYYAFIGDLICAPALLDLNIDPMAEIDEEEEPFHLSSTPSLANLNISSLPLSHVEVQWDCLTTFHADAMYMDEVFEVLRRATRLLECTFLTLYDDIGDYPIPLTPIVHASLRKLHFLMNEESTSELLKAFFDGIELPSLDYLHVDCSESTEVLSVRHCGFQSLFERSRCPLTHFSVCNDMFDGHEILLILEILPTVTEIYLEGEKMMTTSVLKRLGEKTAVEDGTSQFQILPNRRSLTYVGKRKFEWRSLLDAFYPGWTEAPSTELSIGTPKPMQSTTKPFSLHFGLFRTMGDRVDYIDPNIVPHLARFQNEKVSIKLEIEDFEDRLDLIKASLQHYRFRMDI